MFLSPPSGGCLHQTGTQQASHGQLPACLGRSPARLQASPEEVFLCSGEVTLWLAPSPQDLQHGMLGVKWPIVLYNATLGFISSFFSYRIMLYSVLYCSATLCIPLVILYIPLWCSILLYDVLFCYIMLYIIMLYGVLYWLIMLYGALYCSVMLYNCCMSLYISPCAL